MTGRGADPVARLVGVLVVAVVPWTVVVHSGRVDVVFLWGLLDTGSLHFLDVYSYVFAFAGGPGELPSRLLAWPVGTGLYCLAGASTTLGFVGYEDRRVTAGLSFLAGIAHLQVTLGLVRIGESAVPVGVLASFVLAWWSLAGTEASIFGR